MSSSANNSCYQIGIPSQHADIADGTQPGLTQGSSWWQLSGTFVLSLVMGVTTWLPLYIAVALNKQKLPAVLLNICGIYSQLPTLIALVYYLF